MSFYEKENMLFLQRYIKDNPISLEEILQATEESYKEGLISTKEYQKVISDIEAEKYEERLKEAELKRLNQDNSGDLLINDFLSSFKKASLFEKFNMSVDELADYYTLERKYEYFNGAKLKGIQIRKKIHFLISLILKVDQLLSKEKMVNVKELQQNKSFMTLFLKIETLIKEIITSLNRQEDNKPKIYACTHIGGNDIQRAFQIIKDPAWLMFGNPGIVYKKIIYQGLRINGVLPLNTFDKVDRGITYNRALELLLNGGNLLIFPEGAWNVTPNELVMKIFVGAVKLALASGAEIIPLALEQYGKTFYYNLGEGYFIPKNTNKTILELRDELREKLATLKWEILLTQPTLKREDIPDNYLKEFQKEIVERCNYGYGFGLEDALREKFHDKTIFSAEEVFSPLINLDVNNNNAFLMKDKLELVLKKAA